MAKEIQFTDTTGGTDYVNIVNAVGEWWNTAGSAFETFNASNFTDYDIAATEFTGTGVYAADMPTMDTGIYNITARRRAGGSPAVGDSIVAADAILWDGNLDVVAAVTLDSFFSKPAGSYASAGAFSIVKEIVDNAAAILLTSTVEGSRNVLHAIRLILAAAAGKTDGFVAGGTGTGHVQDTTGFKNRITADYDANGNRTATTYDVT